jgi:hypothetical protein
MYKYLPDTEILIITFMSGKVYQYFDVSTADYEKFTKAFSKGSFFNKFIKPNHSFIELINGC